MKSNWLVNALVAAIGLLLIVAALQFIGWGRGVSEIQAEPFDENQIEQLVTAKDDLAAPDIKPEVIDRITQTPLFREDRQPFVEPLVVEEQTGQGPEVIEIKPLKAQVTSIIITGNSSYVMIQDQLTNERLTLKEGMPLDGEQGMWMVDRIDKRKVTFVAEGQEPVELELEVFSGALNKNTANQNRPQNNRNNKNNPTADNDETTLTPEQLRQKKAEEIRRKIAERRAEMRAKAAQGNEQ